MLYEATKSVLGERSIYFPRRTQVYNEIKAMYGVSGVTGYGPGNTKLKTPAAWFTNTLKGSVTSSYGLRDPFGSEFHRGLDIRSSYGAPIYSPIAGEIIETGYDPSGYGYYVVIKDFKGYKHIFGHMNGHTPLRQGDIVSPNTIIGYVGSSGNSTGNHLHYEIRTGNTYDTSIDPNTFKYGSSSIESVVDSAVSKSMNINKTASSGSVESTSEELPRGNGNKSIGTTSDTIIKKLDVAVNTQGVEDKLDILIEAVRDIIELNKKKPGNQGIGYGGGRNNNTNINAPRVTVINSNSRDSSSGDYSGMSLKSIHDIVAKRK